MSVAPELSGPVRAALAAEIATAWSSRAPAPAEVATPAPTAEAHERKPAQP